MREMVCIVCPRGCRLSVGDGPDWPVTGNACARGEAYGRGEVRNPVRTVTATCAIDFGDVGSTGPSRIDLPRRVPVRTIGGVPKDRVGELAGVLHRMKVPLPIRAGDVIIDNWENTGVAVVATRDIG